MWKYLSVIVFLLLSISSPSSAQTMRGRASWYGLESCVNRSNCRTANGERYNPAAYTAAGCSHTFPIGSRVRVRNLSNNRTVTVRVNDTGGFCRWTGSRSRILDLSRGSMEALGGINSGVIQVEATRID